MRSVFYRRCSTDEQAESAAGLNAQLDACNAHALRAGLVMVGSFSDEGVGGAAPLDKRPGLLDALAMIGDGDVLLVDQFAAFAAKESASLATYAATSTTPVAVRSEAVEEQARKERILRKGAQKADEEPWSGSGLLLGGVHPSPARTLPPGPKWGWASGA